MGDNDIDMVKLSSTDYTPTDVVEGYDSLIWTERYNRHGEFKLVTSDIDRFRTLLPEKTLVGIQDSKHVMMVDTHTISRDPNGKRVLTIDGLSATSIFKYRPLFAMGSSKKYKMPKLFYPYHVPLVIMYNAVCNTTGRDLTRYYQVGFIVPSNKWPLPNASVGIAKSYSTAGVMKRRWLQMGPSDEQIFKFLDRADNGFAAYRGTTEYYKVSMTASSTDSNVHGNMSFSDLTAWPSGIHFVVYSGADRTVSQNLVTPIIFRDAKDDLFNADYVMSVRDSFTTVHAMSEDRTTDNAEAHSLNGGGASGWNARIGVFDAGSADEDVDRTEFYEQMDEMAAEYVKQHSAIRAMDSEVAENSQYKFNTDYSLGDLVTVRGQYGYAKDMRVNEFTRTYDREGYKEYPGLVEVT